jgi:hypothetical protein
MEGCNCREGRSTVSDSREYMAARTAESRGGEDVERGNSSGASLSFCLMPKETGKEGVREVFVVEMDLEIKERKGRRQQEEAQFCLKAKVRTVNGGRRERMKGLEKLFDLGCLWRRNE